MTTDTKNAPSVSLSRFWYGAPIAGFLEANPEAVLSQLTSNCEFNLIPTQRDAWLAQIELLRAELNGLAGSVFFEFNIPRMGRRIDVVLTIGPIVFAIEFKVGEKIFMRRKKKRPGFGQSEPEFLISYMDRHKDWAVVVCLVGGGQEINTGEAGIEAWLQAVHQSFPDWHMFISSRLTDSEYTAGRALETVRQRPRTHFDDCLHLAVSMRSFRAEHVSAFVKALLDCETQRGRELFAELAGRYPIRLTRDLSAARNWIRSQARGTERYGLVASSKAMRLKPHAIDIRVSVDPVHYFLNGRDVTRSSFYLEDAATEFQVQGLELDWVCVTWDGDFRFNGSGWNYHDFRGDRWCNIVNTDNRVYLCNAYRVLLTRARQGMVIFVPPGDTTDPTRSPAFYDSTFNYLRELGIPEVEVA